MSQLLLIAALVVFAFACRTFESRYLAKLGWVSMLAASYLAAWSLTGSHLAGAAAVMLWFFLPWLEILGRVRKLRFPMKSGVRYRHPPTREQFPDLDELSSEAEAAGFVAADDTGWQWDETDHFMRLFYHGELRAQAAVTLATQEDFAISYVTITSRTTDGRSYTTSNYPFSLTMKLSPEQRMNRYPDAVSFEDLLASHMEFLDANAVLPETLASQDPEQLTDQLTQDMQVQMAHNVKVGVLEPAGEGMARYSWRGCVFLWFQVVKDMIRV